MATQFVRQKNPNPAPPDDSGFLRQAPTPVWIAPAAPSFEFFNLHKPHFYMIHGVPMAFVSPEVRS